mgnify:CR=1 FL=1
MTISGKGVCGSIRSAAARASTIGLGLIADASINFPSRWKLGKSMTPINRPSTRWTRTVIASSEKVSTRRKDARFSMVHLFG